MGVSPEAVCIRCGDFVAGRAALPGILLCSECFLGKSVVPGSVFAILPPWGVIWRRFRIVIPFTLLSIVLGLGVGLEVSSGSRADRVFETLAVAIVFATGAATASVITAFAVRRHVGLDEWRLRVLAQLGFARDDEALSLVIRTSSFNFFPEPGLLTRGDGGLLFMGVRGTRLVFALEEIAAASVRWVFPPTTTPCTTLRIDGRGGSRHRFGYLEASTYSGNKELATEAVAWIVARVDAKKRPAA